MGQVPQSSPIRSPAAKRAAANQTTGREKNDGNSRMRPLEAPFPSARPTNIPLNPQRILSSRSGFPQPAAQGKK